MQLELCPQVSLHTPRVNFFRHQSSWDVNSGIRAVVRADASVHIVANRPTVQMHPGALTRIPSKLLDRPTRLIRHFAAQERPLIFLLYFNVVTKRWLAWLPRQKSMRRFGSIADVTFQQLTPPLTNDFRLAGSLFSVDMHLWGDVPLLLPSFDGIHLRMHASAWCALSANVVADGKQFLRVDLSRLLSEQLERGDLALMRIIRS